MTATLVPADRLRIGAGVQPGTGVLQTHLATHGPLRLEPGDARWTEAARRAVVASGLFGRGGAGFPAATKWEACRRATGHPVVVVNALEGEPASAKDRVLLTSCPHLVLDGAEVVAAALAAAEIVVCVPNHDRLAADSARAAVDERRRAGLVHVPVSVRRPPGRYVAGEESALVDWLGGGSGLPTVRRSKSVPLELSRRPVLVHNAETLAHVALIARHGADWFRQAGTPDAPGTTLVTVTGGPSGPVVFEVELGTPVSDILVQARVEGPLSGVLLGGYSGTWCDASLLETPFAPGPLAAIGATVGVGAVVALPATACGITETARIARYLAGESAGQCGPCVFGLPAIAGDLELLAAGRADPVVLDRIARRSATVAGRGACRHPDGLARLVGSALRVFGQDARSHAAGQPCPGHSAPTRLLFPPAGSVNARSTE